MAAETRGSGDLRQSRWLVVSGVALATAAVTVYVVTAHAIVSAILLAVGVVFFGANRLVRKSLAMTAHAQLPSGSAPERFEQIRRDVSKAKFFEKVEAEGTLAAEQAGQMTRHYKSLQALLDQKFEPGELTRSRYSDAVIESCLAIGENLLFAKSLLENMNIGTPSTDPQSPWARQKEQVKSVLAANAAALDELSVLHASLSEMTTKDKHRDQLEQSIQQVRLLAERAKQYSRQ